MKTENMLMLGGGAVALYFLFKQDKVKEQLSSLAGGFKMPDFNIGFPDVKLPEMKMPSFDFVGDIFKTAQEGVTDVISKAKDLIPNPQDLIDKAKEGAKGLLPRVVTKDKPTSDYQLKWGLAGKSLEDYTTQVYLPFGVAIGKEPNIFLDFAKEVIKLPFKAVGTLFKAGYEVMGDIKTPPPISPLFTPIALSTMFNNVNRDIDNAISSGGGSRVRSYNKSYGKQFGFTPKTFEEGLKKFSKPTQKRLRDLAEWVETN